MSIKRMTEQDLLEGLDAKGAHADELAEPLPQELEPLERLRGSVKRYIRPTDPVWDECFDSDEAEPLISPAAPTHCQRQQNPCSKQQTNMEYVAGSMGFVALTSEV